METRAEREVLRDDLARAGPLPDHRHAVPRPAHDGLVHAVVVRHRHPVDAGDQLGRVVGAAAEGQVVDAGHLERAGLQLVYDAVGVVRGNELGGERGRPLAHAVARHVVGGDTQVGEHPVEQAARGEDLPTLRLEGRAPLGQRGERAIEPLGDRAEVGVERGLDAGEEEGHASAGRDQSLRLEPHVVQAPQGLALGHGPTGQFEAPFARRDDGQPGRPGIGGGRGRERSPEHDPVELGGDIGAVAPRQQEHGLVVDGRLREVLGGTGCVVSGTRQAGIAVGPVRGPRDGGGVLVPDSAGGSAGAVLFDHDVGVDPAEAEGVHPGAAGASGRPRLGLVDQPEAGVGQGRMGVAGVQGRWQHTVVHGEDGLDQTGRPGSGHGVADHRLHRAQHAARPGPDGVVDLAEHPADRVELRGVARGGGGAVPLDEADRCRVDLGSPVGTVQRQHLPLDPRRHQRGVAPVARHPGAPDDGVDAVAPRLGPGERFEHQDAGALADHDAVGIAAVRTDRARGAERPELVEHRPQRHVVAVVHPAGEHHVAAAGAQLGQGGVDRQQRARARRVDGVGGAAEVEPVGDARGRQVGHEADRCLRAWLAELGGEGVLDRHQAVVVDVGQEVAEAGEQLVGRPHPLVEAGQAGGQVTAPAEDDAHPCAIEVVGAAGVVEGCGRGGQGDELVGLAALGGDRHDAEARRVERQAGPGDEAAPVGGKGGCVDPVLGRGGDGVDPADDVAPEGVRVVGPGEHAAEADDGDGLPVRRGARAGHAPSPPVGAAKRSGRARATITCGAGKLPVARSAASSAPSAASPSRGSTSPTPRRA